MLQFIETRTFPFSIRLVTITIAAQFCSQTILQKSLNVDATGPGK
jgi:hypothetical protein